MASAQKPRKIGLFHSITDSTPATVSSTVSSKLNSARSQGALFAQQARPIPGFRVGVIDPASTTFESRKRSSEDDLDHDRPAKQLRRDSTIQAQIARSHALMRPPIKSVRNSKLCDDKAVQAALRRHKEDEVRSSRLAELTAAPAPSEKQLTTPRAAPTITPVSTYKKARDCGYPPPKDQATTRKSSETTQADTRTNQPSPTCEATAQQGDAMAAPTTSAEEKLRDVEIKAAQDKMKAEKDLEIQREIVRSKSAQVLRLIHTNTELKSENRQEVEELNRSLNDKDRAIYDLEKKIAALEKTDGEYKAQTAGKVQSLETSINTLNFEKRSLEGQLEQRTAAYHGAQESKEWYESQLELARKSEDKTKAENEQLRKDLEKSQKELDDTKTAVASAVEKQKGAEDKASALKKTCRALMGAITAIPGAKLLQSIDLDENLDVDNEELVDDESDVQWQEYVQLPEFVLPAAAPASIVAKGTFGQSSNTTSSPFTSFGKPSIPPSNPPPSFGQPSGVPVATNTQGSMANDNHLDTIALRRAFEGMQQEIQRLRENQDMMNGKNSPPPINPAKLRFDSYIKNLVTENIQNGMHTSSGDVVQMNGDDIGMTEAPVNPAPFTSAYVDFQNAKTFGPDGWPMLEDDGAYQKGVNRMNSKAIEADRHKTRQQEREDRERAKREGKKPVRDHGDGSTAGWHPDPKAGRWAGLDVEMGHNETVDNSKEAFIGSGGGQKRKRDDGKNNNSSSRGGKKSKRGKNANHNNGKGGNNNSTGDNHGKWAQNNRNNNNSNRGGNNSRGGRGGRGGYRGGRGSENGNDAVVGAESGYEPEEDESSPRTKIARLEAEDKGTYGRSTRKMRGVDAQDKGYLSDADPVEEDVDMEDETVGGADEEDSSTAITPRSPPGSGAAGTQGRTTQLDNQTNAGNSNQSDALASKLSADERRRIEAALTEIAAELPFNNRRGRENSSRRDTEQTSNQQRRARRNRRNYQTDSPQSGLNAHRNGAGNTPRGGQMESRDHGGRPAGGRTSNQQRRPGARTPNAPTPRPTQNSRVRSGTRIDYDTMNRNAGPRPAGTQRSHQTPNGPARTSQPASRQMQADPNRYFRPEQWGLPSSTPDPTPAPSRDPRLRNAAARRGAGQNNEADGYAGERAAAEQMRANAKAQRRR